MEEAKAKLRELEARRVRLAARIQRMRGRMSAEERKKDTRRKILAGAYLIRLMGGDLQRVGRRLREAGFLNFRDAQLFGLVIEIGRETPPKEGAS
jgi:large subunit ribosomal protein L7/L12